MILNNYYWCFTKVISKKICEDIINKNKQASLKKGRVGGKEAIGSVRNSKVKFINDKEIFSMISEFVHIANKNAGWNFQWDWIEPIQFTSYGKNEYYGWHADSFDRPSEKPDPNFNGKIRKLSFILQLSDPKNYTGGQLRFCFPGFKKVIKKANAFVPQGSIIVFPSFMQHEVTPVKTGKRFSLVAWCIGKPWI